MSIQLLLESLIGPEVSVPTLSANLSWARTMKFSLKTQDNARDGEPLADSDVTSAQQGDPDAYRRLVERYQQHVAKLLWRFTRDPNTHEELVQESFVQAYLSLPTYKAKAPFENWLARIATRAGYRYWKQSKRHAHLALDARDIERLAEDAADPTDPEQAGQIVHSLLSKLPDRDRLVLTLRYLEQCSVKETAKRTGWTPAMVKVQTHRAKRKLQKMLTDSPLSIEL